MGMIADAIKSETARTPCPGGTKYGLPPINAASRPARIYVTSPELAKPAANVLAVNRLLSC